MRSDLPRIISPNRLRATQHVPVEPRKPTAGEVKSIEQLRRSRAKRELALVDRLIAEVR